MIIISGATKSGEATVYKLVLGLLDITHNSELRARQKTLLRLRDFVSPGGLLRADTAAFNKVIDQKDPQTLVFRMQGELSKELAAKFLEHGVRVIRVSRDAAGIADAIMRHATHSRLFDDPEYMHFATTVEKEHAIAQARVSLRSNGSWAQLGNALDLRFEHLVADPTEALSSLARFLGLNTTSEIFSRSLGALTDILDQPLRDGNLPGEFHGLIYAQGRVLAAEQDKQGQWSASVETYAPSPVQDALGAAELIAHDGVAFQPLKIARMNGVLSWEINSLNGFGHDGSWQVGDLINLEPISVFGDELGGQTGKGRPSGTAVLMERRVVDSRQVMRLMVQDIPMDSFFYNQSIMIDGISLTVADFVGDREIEVNLKEHTLSRTTVAKWEPGRRVKLEPDRLSTIFFPPKVA